MGCDIHMYSETRRGNSWVCDQKASFKMELDNYQEPPRERPVMEEMDGSTRDYWFFGLLNNGVRTDWPWSFQYSCDIPKDASSEVRAVVESWGEDGHSQAMRTRAELKAKLEEIKLNQAKYLIDPAAGDRNYAEALNHHARRLTEVIGSLNSDVPDEDQRLIFWFDN